MAHSPDGRHCGRCATVKFGIGLHRVVEVGVTPESQVVQRHRRLHEVALCILGRLQPGEHGPQKAHYGRGILTDHWTHLQQPMLFHLFVFTLVFPTGQARYPCACGAHAKAETLMDPWSQQNQGQKPIMPNLCWARIE